MNTKFMVSIFQIILSILLIGLILIQAKGYGLSAGIVSIYRSKRGFEKVVFIATIVSAILFVANSIALLKLS